MSFPIPEVNTAISETLASIFIAYARIPLYRDENRLQWTNVTHVSRQWRTVALSCPELWSDIHCTCSPWTTVMFERSRSTPLALTFVYGVTLSTELEQLITTAMSQPGRLRSLTILTVTDFIKERLEELTHSHHLRSLRVEGDNTAALPDAFLSEGAPELKHVYLRGCRFSWASPIFNRLTTLKLSYRTDPTPQQDAMAFIDALERMPNLETLRLDVPFPDFGTEARTVPMICMKKLKLKGPLGECAGALQHMTLPDSAYLRFKFTEGCDEDSAVAAFVSSLTSSWLSAPLSKVKEGSRDIRCLKARGRRIDGRFNDLDVNGTPWSAPLSISPDQDKPISNLISNLPLTELRTVAIDGVPDEDTLLALSRLPSVKRVVVSWQPATMVIGFLKKDPAFGTGHMERVPVTYFRDLELLSFRAPFFVFRGPHEPLPRPPNKVEVRLDELLDLLIWRYEAGGEVQKIKLEGCRNFDENDFKLVQEVVVEVDWDEYVSYKPPDPAIDLDRSTMYGFFVMVGSRI